MENNIMENTEHFHYDGEGTLEQPTHVIEQEILKDYNDKKAFTIVIITAVLLVGGLIATCFIYGIATLMLNIIDAISK